MTLTFYTALTFDKIVKAENVEDFAVRNDHDGNWVLDITYFDDDIEQDISDSMILCDASDENPWTDLIMIAENEEHMEIRASDNMIKLLSIAAECALKAVQYKEFKTNSNSLYGKAVTGMI